ncbi:hypothetical protein SAMN04488564_105466 [Lentzea waywayandensis]|uniref:Uncharacterized protein n=1 Tax=Lentzea waywayandensis TaxID=84724 RepID=A0A1I6ETQ4_9PSEU|nr:hypothetical protein [Lentzea waywayandensis]SFR21115.1 hypothetical protein SAMN04488564_105466 [Lentzea waywayandensis]
MTTFKDNLLDDLMREHGQTVEEAPEQHRRSARPLLVAAGALAIAGAATVAVTSNSSEAYAVTKNADGSVTVTIRDIKGVDAANAKLREYGIGAKAVPMSRDCADLDETKMDLLGGYVSPRISDDGSVTMSPGDIPDGYSVLLGVSNLPNRNTGLSFTGPIRVPVPDCLAEVGN